MKKVIFYSMLFSLCACGGGGSNTAPTTPTQQANRAPVIDVASEISVEEGNELGLAINVSDADGDTITLSLSGANKEDFTLSDRTLNLNELPVFNYQGENNFSVTIEASDGITSTTKDLTITVTEGPFFSPSSLTINEATENFPDTCTDPSIQFLIPVDLNNDNYVDIIGHVWCDLQADLWGTFVTTPTDDAIIAYVSDAEGNYSVQNQSIFGTDRPKLGGASRKYVRGDFNGDGVDDFAFAMNWEDGRGGGPHEWNLTQTAKPAIILSQGDYQYRIINPGTAVWFHAVDAIRESNGRDVAANAGFISVEPNKNLQFFRWEAGNTFSEVSDEFPSVFDNAGSWANTFRAFGDAPNEVENYIFGNYGSNNLNGASLWIKGDTRWEETSIWSIPVDFVTSYQGWNQELGTYGTVNVTSLDGQQYIGGAIDESCVMYHRTVEIKPTIIGKFSAEKPYEQVNEGDVLVQNEDGFPAQRILFFEKDGDQLVRLAQAIENENENVNANFIDCTDFNNDGFDDIVVEVLHESGMPEFYINDTLGNFTRLENSGFPTPFTSSAQGYLYDMNKDGLKDLVIFQTRYQNSDAGYHIYFAKKALSLDGLRP